MVLDPRDQRGVQHGAGAMPTLRVLATPGFADYALVDSGNGRKLERFGQFTVDRPEPQAMWRPALEPGVWLRADAAFKGGSEDEDGEVGRWRKNAPMPETWPLQALGATVLCRLTSFRHLGAFPEQLPHWEWMREWLENRRSANLRVLNLFAYTGAASLIAAAAGAEVTHVDASKRAIAWAKQNQAVSKLDEDADPLDPGGCPQVRGARGAARQDLPRDPGRPAEVRTRAGGRGVGRVPAPGSAVARLRGPARLRPAALVLTTYAIRASALATDALVRECLVGRRGATESGELAVIEEAGGRLLSTSLYSRWTSARCRALTRRAETRAITSLQNERVKLIRSLEMRKVRRETGLFVAEGASVLAMARDAGWAPRCSCFSPAARQRHPPRAARLGAGGRRRMPGGLGSRARQARRQGQPADHARRIRAALGSRARRRKRGGGCLWVVLEGTRDPGNLGTIVRTADAVGAGGVALVGASVDPYSREAVRASMGSVFNVALARFSPEALRGVGCELAGRHRRHPPGRPR